MPRVTIKGQVTIPVKVRKKLGITPGTEIDFVEKNKKFFISKKEGKNPFDRWVGHLKTDKTTDQLMKDLRGYDE